MQIYVFSRAATIPLLKQHLPVKYLIGTGMVLWGLFYLSRTLRRSHAGLLIGGFEFFGMGWMGTLFLLFFAMLVVDFVTLFGFILPRLAPTLRGWALIVGGGLAIFALIQGLRPPTVQKYNVPITGLPAKMDGKKIVALTDMHLGNQLGKSWLDNRIKQVQKLKPDLVVLVGDILDGHDGTMSRLIPSLRRFSAPLGVWAVLGNHEFYRGADSSAELLEKAGITVLRNRWTEIHPGLVLAGVDDLTANRRFETNGDPLATTLTGRPAGNTILLSHTPWQAEKAGQSNVDLMLSGHTHNGQIWPFSYLVRRFYPLLYGYYEVQGMTVIVCRGTGTWGPRMRLWHPGEIMEITLRVK
jgi:hypothetical protein